MNRLPFEILFNIFKSWEKTKTREKRSDGCSILISSVLLIGARIAVVAQSSHNMSISP